MFMLMVEMCCHIEQVYNKGSWYLAEKGRNFGNQHKTFLRKKLSS